MIGSLKGTVFLRDDPYILLDVSGVGYRVLIAGTHLASLTVGQEAVVFTYTHVREDALELFGFAGLEELKLFELLISVSGIGPKTAMGVFSLGAKEEIVQAIAQGNTAFFTSVPRMGSKNAQRIIIDLKNKVGAEEGVIMSSINNDVVQALQAFGFSQKEASLAASSLTTEERQLPEQAQIKHALRRLGK